LRTAGGRPQCSSYTFNQSGDARNFDLHPV
jgi:hypothetical protein